MFLLNCQIVSDRVLCLTKGVNPGGMGGRDASPPVFGVGGRISYYPPPPTHTYFLTFKAESLHEAKVFYRSMEHAVRLLFPQVLVLLLVCPVSSCECERSFSALRRLKTWLRTTMTQRRLNHISICHVHQEQLDNVNVHELAKLFVEKSEIRRNLFGTFE